MNEQAETLRDPELAWVVIQEAAQQQRHAELADIAFSLFGQLGVARAEISRLRASLHASCMRGLSSSTAASCDRS